MKKLFILMRFKIYYNLIPGFSNVYVCGNLNLRKITGGVSNTWNDVNHKQWQSLNFCIG